MVGPFPIRAILVYAPDAGLDFASLTAKELQTIQAAAERAAREGAQRAAEETLEDRCKDEVARLHKRLDELAG